MPLPSSQQRIGFVHSKSTSIFANVGSLIGSTTKVYGGNVGAQWQW
jgi:hypothetical protein